MASRMVGCDAAARAIRQHNGIAGTEFVVMRKLSTSSSTSTSTSTRASRAAVFLCREPGGRQAALRLSLREDLTAVAGHQQRARAGGVPTPPVLGLGDVGDLGYLLTGWTDGVQRERLPGPAMRELVQAIHRMRDQADPIPGRWPSFLRMRADALAQRIHRRTARDTGSNAGGDRFNTLVTTLVEDVRQVERLPIREHDLVHGDLHPANVLVRRRHLSSIIDWELAGAGDHRFDLASLDVWRATTSTGRLPQRWSNPGTRDGTAVLRVYQALATLSLLSWAVRSGDAQLRRRATAVADALAATRRAA